MCFLTALGLSLKHSRDSIQVRMCIPKWLSHRCNIILAYLVMVNGMATARFKYNDFNHDKQFDWFINRRIL